MPYISTINEWLKQSDQLIRAYPTTTRITTKYTLATPSDKSKKRKRTGDPTTANEDESSASAPHATLVLKTFDPQSGACLKYKTDQAAEANRLVRSLSALGQGMAGLDVDVDAVLDAPVQQQVPALKEGVVAGKTEVVGDGKAAVGEGQGKKKKKKGKK